MQLDIILICLSEYPNFGRVDLAIDIAKSLLDYGFYAPTIYFPTNIPESIMIEPTESEDKQTLDRFINAMLEIDEHIDDDLDKIISGPFNTPVSRLDETKANRELNLKWTKDEVQKSRR